MQTNDDQSARPVGRHVPELLRIAAAILEQPLEFPPDDEIDAEDVAGAVADGE